MDWTKWTHGWESFYLWSIRCEASLCLEEHSSVRFLLFLPRFRPAIRILSVIINYQGSLAKCMSNVGSRDCQAYTLMLPPQKHKIFLTIVLGGYLKAQAWFKSRSYFYLTACTQFLSTNIWTDVCKKGCCSDCRVPQRSPERGHHMQKKGPQAGSTLPHSLGRALKGNFSPS